jgi:hypothetical protein
MWATDLKPAQISNGSPRDLYTMTLLMSKKFEHFRSQLGISVQIAAFIVGFPGTHKDKEQEKNCTEWVEIFFEGVP